MIGVTSDKRSLNNVFADIPMSMCRWMNLNLTFDDDEVSFGYADSSGK